MIIIQETNLKQRANSHEVVICLEAYVLKTQSAIQIFFIVVHIYRKIQH